MIEARWWDCPMKEDELELLSLLSEGDLMKDAAVKVGIADKTVSEKLRVMRERVRVKTNLELMAMAVRERWIP